MKWENNRKQALLASIGSAMGSFFAILLLLKLTATIALAIALLLSFFVAYHYSASWWDRFKLYFVTVDDAREVVARILAQKGLPYEIEGDTFFLEEEALLIHLDRYETADWQLKGKITKLIVGPVREDVRLLAEKLQERFDDAFAPRGV